MKWNTINHNKRISQLTKHHAVYLWSLWVTITEWKLSTFGIDFLRNQTPFIQSNSESIKPIFCRLSSTLLCRIWISSTDASWHHDASTTTKSTYIGENILRIFSNERWGKSQNMKRREFRSLHLHIHYSYISWLSPQSYASCHFGKYLPKLFFTRLSGTLGTRMNTLQAFSTLADGLCCMANRRKCV